MDFNHTEERQMLAELLSRFVADNYDIKKRNEAAGSTTGYRPEILSELAELGVIGALFSQDNGGYGGDAFDIIVVFEAIGQGLMLEPLLESAILAGGAIAEAGTDIQKRLIDDITSASKVAGFAHYEPDSRYELEHVQMHAQNINEGWILNGVKAVVKHAEMADFLIVSARTSGGSEDQDGISLFIVPTDTKGLSMKGYGTVDGGRAAELTLVDVKLSQDSLLGEVNKGYPIIERIIGRGLLALTAESLGAMEASKQATVEYIQTRTQFGAPIGRFQALQHRMAEMFIEIEQARSAVINAAAAFNKDTITRERALAAAKYTIGTVGQLVAEETIQIHGGMGMAWELALGHYAKRLILIDHELGDADHYLERYISLNQRT